MTMTPSRTRRFALPLAWLSVLLLLAGPVMAQATRDTESDAERRARELGVGGGSDRDSDRPGRAGDAAAETNQGAPLTEREIAVHVINRLSFGATPGQIDRIMEMGWESWVHEQLNPSTIANERVDSYLASEHQWTTMSMGDIFRTYRPAYTSNPPSDEEQAMRNRNQQRIRRELQEATLYRAVYSERQFEEVIVEFWRNHFNIDQQKDDVGYLANHFEEQVIRRFAFGKFEHMLLSSARHPGMLIYLDNIVSQKPLTEREQRLLERFEARDNVPRSIRALGRQRGLNENYARELMELHTLGVDREYTQRDVTELARVLTGWTARWEDGSNYGQARDGRGNLPDYGFYFRDEVHDPNNKRVLGTLLRGGGEDQGIRVVRALANHRYTADHISRKLCRYLINDEPSEALVAEIARVFERTDGDLPQVYEAIIMSDDFLFRQNHQVKFKTPFEYVVSALRASGARVDNWGETRQAIALMGQPIYQCEDPTGYEDTAEAWLDPGVLVYRWSYALKLANNEVEGVRVGESVLANLPRREMKEKLMDRVLPGGVSDHTNGVLDRYLEQRRSASDLLGLLLGSPDFQQQ
ncbi:DUF1800 domain-containing protein [Phycisphaeraceae bacterium D3-23]